MSEGGKSSGRGGRAGRGGHPGGAGRGRGRGRTPFGQLHPQDTGTPRSMAGGGSGEEGDPDQNCVCPKCGHRQSRIKGRPCAQRKCPKCNTHMTRFEKKA